MSHRVRILLLLTLALVLMAAGILSAKPKPPPGLICGTPDDPIPCSTFNTSSCTYFLDPVANCCNAGNSCPRKCC